MSSACLNRIFLLFIYCVPTVKLASTSFKINWTIGELPSSCIFGSNVTLFCNTSAVGLQKATWMKQSDVILHQGLSFYPDKYTGKERTNGSSLIIMNATESDFNTSYTCLADVFSYEAVLKMNSSNFMCLPRNANSSWTIIGRNISVHLNFDRFFPVPNCTTTFNENILITNQQESVHLENQFFHGTINVASHSNFEICGGNLTVVCNFGCYYSDVIATKFLQDCEYIIVNDNSEYGFIFWGTVIGVIVALLCVGSLLFLYLHVRVSQSKPIKGDKQHAVIPSEIIPFQAVVKNEKSDKKETENKTHSQKPRTHTLRNYFMNNCVNLKRKKTG